MFTCNNTLLTFRTRNFNSMGFNVSFATVLTWRNYTTDIARFSEKGFFIQEKEQEQKRKRFHACFTLYVCLYTRLESSRECCPNLGMLKSNCVRFRTTPCSRDWQFWHMNINCSPTPSQRSAILFDCTKHSQSGVWNLSNRNAVKSTKPDQKYHFREEALSVEGRFLNAGKLLHNYCT